MKHLILISLFLTSAAFAKSALIVVDMQKCFVPGKDSSVHSLPVTGGNSIVSGINKYMKQFDLVVATKDWHPKGHVSFASSHEGKKPFESIELQENYVQALWPDHCVQDSTGSEFVDGLDTKSIDKIVKKGSNDELDSYSGFFDNLKKNKTEMDEYLRKEGVDTVYVVGLAADYCVKFTAVDAASLGYKTYFVKDLTKAVVPANLDSIYKELEKNNVTVIKSEK